MRTVTVEEITKKFSLEVLSGHDQLHRITQKNESATSGIGVHGQIRFYRKRTCPNPW